MAKVEFVTELLNEAATWLDCREDKKSNRSACVDIIHKDFSGGWSGAADHYCAKFVYVITDKVCKQFGMDNPLFKSASTHSMLKGTKLRKDKTPAVGSIFFYDTTKSNTSTGHVGFVKSILPNNRFTTIEGNTTVGKEQGMNSKTHSLAQRKYTFIHLEDVNTARQKIDNILSFLGTSTSDAKLWAGVGIVAVCGLGYLAYRS